MINIKNIRSLTDFLRNARQHVQRLGETGEPEVLTVNGKAEVVIQDAESYQRLLDEVEYADTVRTLRRRLAAFQSGEKGIPVEDTFKRILAELGRETDHK